MPKTQERSIRMFPFQEKVDAAIALIREHEPPEGYFLAFSGGKDSVVIYDLAVKSGVKFDAHYNNTQIDPPELRLFIRWNYPDVDWIPPKKSMFELIEMHNYLPTRLMRFCCKYLKEHSGMGRTLLDGIRGAESTRRAKRKKTEKSYRGDKVFVHAIFDWADGDVWKYIRDNSIAYCRLYDEGWSRIGCLGCPMGTKKQLEFQFERYPGLKKAYLRSVKAAFLNKPHKYFGTDYELYFEWWMSKLSVKEFFHNKRMELNTDALIKE